VFTRYKYIITVEDGCLQGGVGSAVLEFMADHKYNAQVIRLGIPDEFIEHGEQPELWALCGYDTVSIINTVKKIAIGRTTKIMAS
jgi:1-deoxy-D-xylulose-5-phosphate synthase